VKGKKRIFTATTVLIFSICAYNGMIQGYSLTTGVIAYFVLVTFVINDSIITKFTPSLFVMLGNISFSWYLLHNTIGGYISWQAEANNPGAMHNVFGFTALLVSSIVISWLSHRYIEGWLTSKIRNRVFSSKVGRFVDMRKPTINADAGA